MRRPARLSNPTTPVAPRPIEIGLLTANEFLAMQNPQGKHHPSDSYDFGVAKMNDSLAYEGSAWLGRGRWGDRDRTATVYRGHAGDYLLVDKDCHARPYACKPVAVISDGVLYHERGWSDQGRHILVRRGSEETAIPVSSQREVKYLASYADKVKDPRAYNLDAYPHLMRRLVVDGEPMELRAAEKPVPGKGTALAILNAEGRVVAQAQDEWGATLRVVAREYRKRGLGRIIGEAWAELNPNYTSGGFTAAGERSELQVWADRVRELSSLGWYTELVRRGTLTKARVAEITKGATGKRAPSALPDPRPTAKKAPIRVRFLIDPGQYFVIYNADALETDEVDESQVFAHGFFRDSESVGTFLFAIDYDPAFGKLATEIALQMARDEKERLYVGPGYGDHVELDGIDGVKRDGDYVELEHDVADLRLLGRTEKRERKRLDRHDERFYSLLEIANAKWQ